MSMPEPSSENPEAVPSKAVEYERFDPYSVLEGLILVVKYLVDDRVQEVETMFINKSTPPPDLSGGWKIVHDGGEFWIIQRLLR